jgi:ABC-type antimicrobial peptide transport system permease subunit
MALGASSSGVMGLIVRDVLAPVTVGAACGLVSLMALAGIARPFVFGVSPVDPASLAVALFVLFAAATGAAYLPARHAARIDPLRTMRRS